MKISRRNALLATGAALGLSQTSWLSRSAFSSFAPEVVHSITPVVSDGFWIWKDQPADQVGMVDGREFEVSVGVRWKTDGPVRDLKSTTVAPVGFPEQEILDFEIHKSDGCDAQVVPLTETAGQLQVSIPFMERGQVCEAEARYRMKISRVCPHFDKDRFPASQEWSAAFRDNWLGNSPGIRSDLDAVARVVREISSRHLHPWDKAKRFHAWVWENIHGKPGEYTSVREALKNRQGDCEERAGVFIALCRAAGIPARLVWVPNHSWAEFCLRDYDGKNHWIPVHTAAYSWFGWTGAHELVLQKGDRIRMPGKNSNVRLISDWYAFDGRRPQIEFLGSVTPIAESGVDPGPGKRVKNAQGGWDLVGKHRANRIIRGN